MSGWPNSDAQGRREGSAIGADAATTLLAGRMPARADGSYAHCSLSIPDSLWRGCSGDGDREWRIASVVALVAARLVPPDSVLGLAIESPHAGFPRRRSGTVDPQWSLAECERQLRAIDETTGDPPVVIRFTAAGDVQLRGLSAPGIERLGALVQRAVNAQASPGRMERDAGIQTHDLLDSIEVAHLDRLAGYRLEYDRDATVADCFESIVQATPDALALRASDGELRYAELEARANRFAWQLLGAGVRAHERVGVALGRSLDLAIAYLGIVKAGAVFVPLDDRMPADRVASLLDRMEIGRVVVSNTTPDAALPPRVERLRIDRDAASPLADAHGVVAPPPRTTRAEDPAYVMFTSGSTGEPKGVVVPHRAIVRLARSADYVALDADTVMLGYAPVSFDASTLEVWGPLLNGGRLALAPPGLLSLSDLAAFIEAEKCTVVWLTSGLFNELVDAGLVGRLQSVRCLLTGGDVVSPAHVRRALAALPRCALVNGYGPTENTTFSCCYRIEPGAEVPAPLPIGRPIANSSAHVLDQHGVEVPVGAIGELWVGGDGVALGYVGGTAADDERFVASPDVARWAGRRYRTGDLVRWRDDECLEFLGRSDTQIKLRGFRVEPGEVEAALRQHPAIIDGAVVATGSGAQRQLVAHVVPRPGHSVHPSEVRTFLRGLLADYMVPAVVTLHERLPVTATGKVDRRMLSASSVASAPDGAASPVRAEADVETILREIFARVLALQSVGPTDGFFDLGGASLSALVVLETLRREHGITLPVADFFAAPSPAGAAARLGAARASTPGRREAVAPARQTADAAIAIVGMAGRFPGAPSVDAFWRVVCDGVDTVERFDPATLDTSVSADDRSSPDYVAARGMLTGVEEFAAGFFGVPRRQAELMDPQLRVLTEVAWEALESCSLVPERSNKTIGVFAGMNFSGYLFHHVLRHPELVRAAGPLPVQFATEKDYVATGLAHRLDLTGPAVSINTACSTSLVAIAQACLALRAGQCDVALAGGVSITVPQRVGHRYDEGSMLSRDGTTRPFDRDATGTVFSDGAGIVVLKLLADAEADGDSIQAVIRGVAVNNDGARRASFTAPSVDGQRRVIRRALVDAGWSAASIGYVEAHGTATPLGDPIEVEALTRTYREDTDETGFCAIGSVKGNIGHCTIAAGVAGVIKTALSLRHGMLPASLHFENPNPQLAFETTPFRVNATTRPWLSDGRPRRAGVSAFGVGGTNAHVLLEEYIPAVRDRAAGSPANRSLLLPFSAETPKQLSTLIAQTAESLPDSTDELADLACTLGTGRRVLRHRAFVIAPDAVAARSQLGGGVLGRIRYADAGLRPPRALFLFAGQGTQYPGMAAALHRSEPVFRGALDAVLAVFESEGVRVEELLMQSASTATSAERLRQTAVAQPAIFAMQVATARLWMDRGVRPDGVLGHSIGEFAAAVIAGVFDLGAAARLVVARGRAMQACAPGGMLSVRAAVDAVIPYLSDQVELAADNAPAHCVLAGTEEALATVAAALERAGVAHRRLETSHAFHSSRMEPAVTAFASALTDVTTKAAECTFISSCTGAAVGSETLGRAEYWTSQLRSPVRFREALLAASDDRLALMLDVGPRSAVAPLARQTLAFRSDTRIVSSFDVSGSEGEEADEMVRALGNAWLAGAPVDFTALYGDGPRRRARLTPYPLRRERYWLDRPQQDVSANQDNDGDGGDVAALIERQQEVLRLQLSLLATHV